MATYRIGIGSFNLKDGAVGIGTEATGLGNLKVEGTYKTTDLDVTGVSTFTRYAGFAGHELNISKDVTLTGEHQTTGDIVVGVNSTFTVSVGATVHVGTVPSVSIGTHFSPPTGGVEDRQECPVEGTVRFNKDLNTLEFYNGVDWRQFTVSGASGRAIIAGGNNPGYTLEYFNISTLGNSEFFGMLTAKHLIFGCFGSSTRGIAAGGYADSPTPANSLRTIEYWNIASLGDAVDFGDLTQQGIRAGAFASPTRGFFAGGFPTYQVNYDMVTIASKGNAIEFGNLTAARSRPCALANSVMGFSIGGSNTSDHSIDRTILASGGNAVVFGDSDSMRHDGAGTNTHIRGVFSGGNTTTSPAKVDSQEYFSLQTGGTTQDFGNLTVPSDFVNGTSDSHGGLGGY